MAEKILLVVSVLLNILLFREWDKERRKNRKADREQGFPASRNYLDRKGSK
jgi:hypothetical protein